MTTNNIPAVRPGHPRLMIGLGGFAALKSRIAADPLLQEWQGKLRERAVKLLAAPPLTRELGDGVRLLPVSRQVLERVQVLALTYHLSEDARFRDRCWRELAAAATFTDWNPKHFLDTAEMTHALAIGYDWLYDQWSADQRATLRQAIVAKGLQPGLACYRGEIESKWWVQVHHNWNQVCNGGLAIGALAVADEEPALAAEILKNAIGRLPAAMHEYGPDGAWAEGPGYWHYATRYNVYVLAALETALGTDLGLGAIPGFADAGLFVIYLSGPTGETFNYADGGRDPIHAPDMFWLARRFRQPAYAAWQERAARPDALDLIWREPGRPTQPLPLDRYFRRTEVAALRSEWNNPNGTFVGFKAGDNQANHSHLDIGSFVLDGQGVRWAVDLGREDYNLPGYWDTKKQRWDYYRLRAESHNTLVLNPGPGADQNPTAATKIIRFQSQPRRAFAIADLSAAYQAQVQRGMALLERREVLVQDEVKVGKPAELWWFLHTPARIRLSEDGRTATLSQAGKQLVAQLLAPTQARFTDLPAAPLASSPNPPGQSPNKGIRKLAIQLTGVTETTIAVLLSSQDGQRPTVVPLAKW